MFNVPKKKREIIFLEMKVIEPILTPVSRIDRTPQELTIQNLDNIFEDKVG